MGAAPTILWDFDGTLAYRDGLWSGCLAEVLQEHEPELAITRDHLRPHLTDGFPWHSPETPHPELCEPEAWWERAEGLLARAAIQVGLPPEKAADYARKTHERYIDCASFTVFDDTVPVLESLRDQGWRHVILSNHIPELQDIVDGIELSHLVDAVFNSAVTGYEKPNPRAYEIAREACGHPTELWMVGDNPEADVRGAEAVGIPAVLVRTQDASVERVAADLYEVARYVS